MLAAGAATRNALATALGLAAPESPFSVSAAAWMDHALELAVHTGADEPAVLRIEARTEESKGLVVTRHLNLYFRGTDLPRPLITRVAERARRSLADWTLDQIAGLVSADPELGQPGLPMPPTPDETSRPASLLDSWGADDSYADKAPAEINQMKARF